MAEKTEKKQGTRTADASDDQKKRDQALDRALAQIEKQYGKGSVMRLGGDQRVAIGAISTGSIS